MRQAFVSMRDGHLNYFLPQPYNAYKSYLPFEFQVVYDQSKKPHVMVSQVRADLIQALNAPAAIKTRIANLALGDEILEYNDQPIWRTLVSASKETSSPNPSARLQNSLAYLTQRFHLREFIPQSDEVTLKIRKNDGTLQTINIPWIVKGQNYDSQNPPDPETLCPMPSNEIVSEGRIGDDFRYGKLNNAHGTIGYLRFGTFNFSENGNHINTRAFSFLIASVLREYNQTTKGLIIDLRDNTGGSMEAAQVLPRLFSDQYVQGLSLRTTSSGTARETRRKTEKTNLVLEPRKPPNLLEVLFYKLLLSVLDNGTKNSTAKKHCSKQPNRGCPNKFLTIVR